MTSCVLSSFGKYTFALTAVTYKNSCSIISSASKRISVIEDRRLRLSHNSDVELCVDQIYRSSPQHQQQLEHGCRIVVVVVFVLSARSSLLARAVALPEGGGVWCGLEG